MLLCPCVELRIPKRIVDRGCSITVNMEASARTSLVVTFHLVEKLSTRRTEYVGRASHTLSFDMAEVTDTALVTSGGTVCFQCQSHSLASRPDRSLSVPYSRHHSTCEKEVWFCFMSAWSLIAADATLESRVTASLDRTRPVELTGLNFPFPRWIQ